MMRLIVALLLLLATDAMAQHNHAEGHNEYATWASHKATNCCNNMDCGVLNDDEWRETSTVRLIDFTVLTPPRSIFHVRTNKFVPIGF